MKEELEIKVECGHSSNVRVFYFPPPTPEIADSTLWVPDIIEKSQFKSILESIKSPKLLEIAIYNLGEFCFEVIKRIIEELGEKNTRTLFKNMGFRKSKATRNRKRGRDILARIGTTSCENNKGSMGRTEKEYLKILFPSFF